MTETICMATRFRLAELLEAAGPAMNQSELARRSGVSIVTINSMANNRTKQVSLSTLDALSEALGVEPGDLLEREPKKRGKAK
jgi:DNA-binding Xre family transcriptional regulator